jgi:hypothetical protein
MMTNKDADDDEHERKTYMDNGRAMHDGYDEDGSEDGWHFCSMAFWVFARLIRKR